MISVNDEDPIKVLVEPSLEQRVVNRRGLADDVFASDTVTILEALKPATSRLEVIVLQHKPQVPSLFQKDLTAFWNCLCAGVDKPPVQCLFHIIVQRRLVELLLVYAASIVVKGCVNLVPVLDDC